MACVRCVVLGVETEVEDYYTRLGLVPWDVFVLTQLQRYQGHPEPYRQIGLSTHEILEHVAYAEKQEIRIISTHKMCVTRIEKMCADLGIAHIITCEHRSVIARTSARVLVHHDHFLG